MLFPQVMKHAGNDPAFRMHGWTFALVLLFVWPLPFTGLAGTNAPIPYSVRIWQTDEGLPQNSVHAIAQTRDGYLWVGTREGLARFDGVRFTVVDEAAAP